MIRNGKVRKEVALDAASILRTKTNKAGQPSRQVNAPQETASSSQPSPYPLVPLLPLYHTLLARLPCLNVGDIA